MKEEVRELDKSYIALRIAVMLLVLLITINLLAVIVTIDRKNSYEATIESQKDSITSLKLNNDRLRKDSIATSTHIKRMRRILKVK